MTQSAGLAAAGPGFTGQEEQEGSSEREVTLRIDGMHCGSCIRRVTQAIHGAGRFGVKEVRLGAARFTAPEGREMASADVAIAALSKAGFTARLDD